MLVVANFDASLLLFACFLCIFCLRSFGDSDSTLFTLTLPESYPTIADGEHLVWFAAGPSRAVHVIFFQFVFSESAKLSNWLMRMRYCQLSLCASWRGVSQAIIGCSDFCERRSTKTLAIFLSKAAAVYLEETDDDDDNSNNEDDDDDDDDANADVEGFDDMGGLYCRTKPNAVLMILGFCQ